MKYKRITIRLSRLLVVVGLSLGALCCSRETPDARLPGGTETAAELIAQADKLYAEREDLTRLRAGITALRRARAAEPSNYEAEWRLAKFNYYLGAHTNDKRERDKAFRDGAEAGQRAVELQKDKPDGHFWLGANYGGSAEHSTLAGLTGVDDIVGEMETVLRLDEGYQSGSAYMALGQVYLKAPRMLGGDQQKAVAMLEKGLRFGENNAFLRLRLAEAYVAVKRYDDARKQLDALSNLKPHPDYLPEYKEAIAEAEKLRSKIP
ncbi:MAG: tetratricopeptide repeat protein [Pyrinomonadaceae bacterium]|nr:tetratricopeptide repeat protein [Pyrinomonadaceae bacterium]